MKRPSLCCIALIILWGSLAFIEIQKEINGEKADPINHLVWGRPSYAKMVEIKAYLLSDQEVAELISHPEMEVQQPSQKELYRKNVNVVLRIKNHGGVAWGTLAYSFDHIHWRIIDVSLPFKRPKDSNPYFDHIIPIGIAVTSNEDIPPKPILTKWNALFSPLDPNKDFDLKKVSRSQQ